jgi:tungstate transport system permease protein
METIFSGFLKAAGLLISFDKELYGIILLSLIISGGAVIIATFLGLPLGIITGLKKFFGRDFLATLLNTFMGLPPVVVGLTVYLILSRSGPLGFMDLIYTPYAMVIAQVILATPIIAALSHSTVVAIDPIIRDTARTLGATSSQIAWTIIQESRYSLVTSVIAGFGRITAEVGAVLIVGGNIAGYTRVMTTTIALETSKGEFGVAIALGIILILISFLINSMLHAIRKKGIR